MHKKIAIAAVVMFLMAGVPAFADPLQSTDVDTSITDVSDNQTIGGSSGENTVSSSEIVSSSDEGQTTGSEMESKVEVAGKEAKLIATRTVEKAKVLENRVIEKYEEAKDAYLSAKTGYLNTKASWLSARAKYLESKSDNSLKFAVDAAKAYLTNAIDAAIRHLKVLDSKVNGLATISEEDKASLLSDIDQYVAFLEEKKAEVAAAQTKDDVEKVSVALKEAWTEIRPFEQKAVAIVLNTRIKAALNKAEALEKRVQTRIDALKEKGYDTAGMEAVLAEFKEKIGLANEKYEAAKLKYGQIENVKDANKLLADAHRFVKDANQYVKEAQAKLKELFLEMVKAEKNETGE